MKHFIAYSDPEGNVPSKPGKVLKYSIFSSISNLSSSSLSLPHYLVTSLPHYLTTSLRLVSDGHDRSPVQLPDRIMQQLYRPAFQAAIDAGVIRFAGMLDFLLLVICCVLHLISFLLSSAMESYQEVGGVPMASSSEYLKTLLRNPGNMNYSGVLVTDYREIMNLNDWHMVASSQKEAVRMAMLDTSIDMSMVPTGTTVPLVTLILA